MLVEFESAVLSVLASGDAPVRKIGWFLQSTDVNSASSRYRCFHFARVLTPQFESRYFTALDKLQEALADLDAVIVIKRLDRAVVDLVASAQSIGLPIFLDLCDDLISPAYAKNERGLNLVHFLGIAPLLAGVTVPSAEMADRVEGYAMAHGLAGPQIHVVPDIAEDWDVFRSTYEFVTGTALAAKLDHPDTAGAKDIKRLVWFGNYGSSHSNFGIFSLKPFLKPLRAVSADIPLELVIVSNSEPVYRALVHDCGFATRFVQWSPQAVYSELGSADAALLTTGDDEFCSIKSSNRVLQALAMDVPVITSRGPAVTEFEDVIFAGRVEDSLRLCLGHARQRVVPQRIEAARPLLARYTAERLGGVWASLLASVIAKRRRAKPGETAGKLLHIIEPGDSPRLAGKLFSAVRRLPNVAYELLVSTEAMAANPEFTSIIGRAPNIPRFYSGPLKDGRNFLLGVSGLLVERPEATIAKTIAAQARRLGTTIVRTREALDGALSRFERRPDPLHEPARNNIVAGPNPERLNSDGTVDWCFVVHQNARGWILDAICREIGSRQRGSWQVCYHPCEPPKAANYFFSHHALLEAWLERFAMTLDEAKLFVWYTHPREENPLSVARQLLNFERTTKVVFACESNRRVWVERGLPEEKTAVVLGAADPDLFRYHERGGGVVGLSSSFYERKNPDALLEVIRRSPDRQFLLLGRKWNQYALFEEMKALPNFTYRSAPYSDYPAIYGTFDVFLSMSSLEGGPIPLIEAMMSNAVPVASRTGFAPDLIRHGENGFLFDLDAPPESIAEMIERAFALPGNIRETVVAYDWDRFSAEIVNLAG